MKKVKNQLNKTFDKREDSLNESFEHFPESHAVKHKKHKDRD